jgi:hypothetical protein
MQETIRFIQSQNSDKWSPIVGETTERLLTKQLGDNEEAKEILKRESYEILKLCGDPKLKNYSSTGLVVGYIQSGKTFSFTTVTALAKDNNYKLIIILAGTTKVLHDQTNDRINKDLESKTYKEWSILKINDKSKIPEYIQKIDMTLDWRRRDDVPKSYQKTLVLTVMKNHDNLSILNSVLEDINLDSMATLIIDDESDQASLNTMAYQNSLSSDEYEEFSTTYQRIINLKKLIPNHTFLQYTATPQANMFIDIDDELSPEFIYVLTPGKEYTGGKVFFSEENSYLIKILDDEDLVSSADNMPPSAPESLYEAMRIFFIGVAEGQIRNEECVDNLSSKNRTMMINPHHEITPQNIYGNWAKLIKNIWIDRLREKNSKTIQDFKSAYDELAKHINDLHPFEEIVSRLEFVIGDTHISILNTDPLNVNDEVNWENYSNILIGGNKLSRGYTVEGLTVTYMPRNLNENSNSDTFQQRARFYGYRKNSIPFSRLYMDEFNRISFKNYSDSEEKWRRVINEFISTGKSLNEFKREFEFDVDLNWTRSNVLKSRIIRKKYTGQWTSTDYPHTDSDSFEANLDLFNSFYSKQIDTFIGDSGHPDRTEFQKHKCAELPVKEILEFINAYSSPEENYKFEHLKSLITGNINKKGLVYIMSPDRNRVRSINRSGKIDLFQGSNSSKGVMVYPGDGKIRDDNQLTIQIHKLDIKSDKESNEILFHNVIGFAVWLPRSFGGSMITQEDLL